MADTYWLRRQRRSDERMARRERSLEGRVRRVYERELRDLEREIADYYERYGEDGVLRYRSMLQTMGDADRRLLIEDCEEFARQHPDLADMVEIRKSIYKLDRLEGLRTSVRLHLARATSEAAGGLDEHFAQDAADSANAVAETMGYGSSFYSADSEIVRQFVGTAWSDGESYSDKIWKDARAVASYVERDLSKALVRGASYQSLCREMQRRFEGQSVSNIMRVVQTEGTYVARQAQGAEMRREGFEEYFIDPLGDKRTCEECRRLGRQSHEAPFRFEDAEVGVNYPPIHPRCRCEVNPAVEDWDEWLRKRRAERRAQAAASEVSDEAVAKRFGAWDSDEESGISRKRNAKVDAGVDFDIIDSAEYGRSFEGVTGNSDADAMLLKCARAILRHRSGTGSEDLYLVSTVDGSVKGYQTASRTPLSVEENASIARAVSESPAGTLFAIHNHPTNVPPTGSDFVASGRRGYAGGVVVLHDGGIYAYRHGDKPFSASAFDMTVERYRKKGNIDKKAFELAMRDFEGRFGITWRRIR